MHSDHFDTEHLRANLRGRSARGGAVTLVGQLAGFLLTLASTMVLARLLSPSDFGLLAMVAAFTGFLHLFRNIGLSQAVIQRREITHEQVSALFWINVTVSSVVALIASAAAPAVAWFYDEPALLGITIALGSFILVSGFAVQHQALLARQMRFGATVVADLGAELSGIAVAIVLAWIGAGYWALVALAGGRALGHVLLTWTMCRWRPSLMMRGTGVRSMVTFGANITGFNVVNYWARNLDNLLIGWRWGAQPLGLYSRAYSLLMLPLTQINGPASRVALPALSRVVEDPERYRRGYGQIVGFIMMLTVPAIAFLIVMADWVILVVLGAQWISAAPIFAWLGLAGLIQPLSHTTGWLFITQDRTREMLVWGIIGSALSIAAFVVGLPYGPVGVAAAYAVTSVAVKAPLLFWWVGRRGPVSALDLLCTIKVPLYAAIAVAAAARATRFFVDTPHPILGLGLALVAALLGAGLVLIATVAGRQTLRDARSTLSLLRRGSGQSSS